ncbi:MAG: 4Fe-4S dicluster domain-containing protein, partial [Roseiflexaceae bacterium]|nr:4Fe-4S dicluster domain-containing protein [Roseiflexaceae bacterium]
TAGTLPENAARYVTALAADLQANRGSSAVIAGEGQPAEVHALVHAINAALGNVGTTVRYIEPVEALPEQAGTLADLVGEMNSGAVQALVMLDVNPVYTSPADLRFADALAKVPFSAHYGLYNDETAEKSTWHVPATHYLEHWSDARAYDGTATIVQPLIAPIYKTKSVHEVVAALAGQNDVLGYDLVRATYEGGVTGNFTRFWEETLAAGVVPDTAAAAATPTLASGIDFGSAPVSGEYELVIQADTRVFDGSYANNGWLQELPHTISKISWDNAAYVGVSTAEKLAVRNGDVVSLTVGGASVDAPIWILPGTAEGVIGVQLGYGRTKAGIVGTWNGQPVGFDAYALRTSTSPNFATAEAVTKTGRTYPLASTQDHHAIDLQNQTDLASTEAEKRHIAQAYTLDEYRANPNVMTDHQHEVFTLYPARQYTGYAWGMSIDLNTCTGCNACVMACNTENSIAVVGKEEVLRGREMHWIRIDRYFTGKGLDNPQMIHQPLACQHCENAPCEVVCPVGATVHDSEGLNNMVYNRCVGTKYCSNNCPFKVRRFNFLQYNDMLYKFDMDSLKMMRNPDVTVRVKGVMEKCTYCVQRINEVRQDKERLRPTDPEAAMIRDGDVVTACQQACPTDAISFGNLNDPEAAVTQRRKLPLSYTLLNELNVFARTSYMGMLKNPNPELAEA